MGAAPPALQVNGPFSILAYIRKDGNGEGNFGQVFTLSSGTTVALTLLVSPTASTRYRWALGSGTALTPRRDTTTGITIATGKWHHVGASNPGNSLTGTDWNVYLGQDAPMTLENGSDVANGTASLLSGSGHNLVIGNRDDGARTWNGLIGYVARWNRILTLTEFRLAQELGPLAVPDGLVLLWSGGRDYGPLGLIPTSTTAVVTAEVPPVSLLGGMKRRLLFDGVVGGGATSYTDSLSDAADASDSASSALVALQSESDSVAATDTASTALQAVNALADAGAANDTATSALSAVNALADAAAATDTASSVLAAVNALADSAAATDTATGDVGAQSYTESLSDEAAASDAIAHAASLSAALVDAAAATDAFTLSGTVYTESLTDTAAAADSIGSTAVMLESCADLLAGSDIVVGEGGTENAPDVLGSLVAADRRTQKARRVNVQTSRRRNIQTVSRGN